MVFGKFPFRRTNQDKRMGPCASKTVHTVGDEAIGSTRPKSGAPPLQEKKPSSSGNKSKKKGFRARVSGAAGGRSLGGGTSPTSGRKTGLRSGNASLPGGYDRTTATASSAGTSATDKNSRAYMAGWVENPAWAALLQEYQSRIVDPSDVRIVMEEEASHRIDQLSPAQVVLLQRRVRKIVHDLLATAPPPTTTTSAMMNTMMGRIGQSASGGNSSSSYGHSNGGNHASGGGSGGSNGNSVTNDDAKSRTVFSKEHLLDEGLFRKIFEGGERLLQMGWEEGWHEGSKAEFVERQKQKAGENGHLGSKEEQRSTSRSSPPRAPATLEKQYSAKQFESNGGTTAEDHGMAPRGSNGARIKASRRRRGSGKGIVDSDPGQIAASPNFPGGVDVFGAAYLLLLHAAEERWDYVAAVAELSAEAAGLTLDVNEMAKQAEEEAEAKEAAAAEEEEEEEPPSLSPKKVRVPPPPMRRGSYDELGSQPPLPNGVSFSSITFLLAVALYGTREEKLNLLFYLLLPPKRLKSLLDDHPAGGMPTWLLESGSENILSYASLSHWYYFSGTVPPDGTLPVGNEQDGVKGAESLTINSAASIQMMAILLQGALEVDDDDDDDDAKTTATVLSASEMTTTTTMTRKSSGEVERRVTGGIAHELLSEVLNESRSAPADTPCSYTTNRSVLDAMMDQFWGASSHGPNGSAVWTEVDFFQWADKALHDGALDIILWRLFGTGLLTSPAMERDLVSKCWLQWEKWDLPRWAHQDGAGSSGSGLQKLFHFSGDGNKSTGSSSLWPYAIYGGLGGADGLGGLGHGVVYCIDKSWWTQWEEYCSWKWNNEEGKDSADNGKMFARPAELSPERLLDRLASSGAIPGTLGSFETMKADLKEGVDFVTVPPPVWDVLYELYGGGQPLPRMTDSSAESVTNGSPAPPPAPAVTAAAAGVEVVAAAQRPRPSRLPRELVVIANPWVVHCQACDPFQPYRRGEVGTLSIRVMSAPSQPLWRLFAEIAVRLPCHHPRAKDSDGLGRARLWKRLDPAANKEAQSGVNRYGPWALLCKSRNAQIPVGEGISYSTEVYKSFVDGWKQYGDGLTVEKAGLADGGRVMFEFAVISKDGSLSWPREAAAKAGRARRLQEEDTAFRQLLRGLDTEGKLKKGGIIDTEVDALDASGRWYRGIIVQVDNTTRNGEETLENGKRRKGSQEDESMDRHSSDDYVLGENKAVRVEFRDADGHFEWIDVKSDRLAVAGRFISDSIKSELNSADNESGTDSKKSGGLKKLGRDAGNDSSSDFSNGGICQFPGYGACGLSNLGNTCYANSALQCLGNTPLIRSYFLSGQYSLDLNKDNPLGTGGKVLLDFVELMRLMWSGKYGMKAPSKFRSTLGRARPQYSGGDQQDAQEFLNDILDILHEDGNRVLQKPYVEAPEDAWIKNVGLPRVGLETWRRFLRRNQSVMTNVAMGQVLNRVTCPVCNYTSWNFDPFNMLSTPFPTVAEVVFRVRLIRRATVHNCPSTLDFKGTFRKEDAGKEKVAPPSPTNVMEEYVIQIPRLADIGELKTRLQNMTNVSSHRMRLYRGEEIPVDKTEDSPIRTYVKVSPLPDKEGPCVQLTKQPSSVDEARGSGGPTFLVAFESTLYPRPLAKDKEKEASESTEDGAVSGKSETKRKLDSPEKEDPRKNGGADAKRSGEIKNHSLAETMSVYGNREECRMYDTNPMELAKVISRSIWPETPADFQLGLRVDAIDHRKNWFAGSVIGIEEGDDESKDTSSTPDTSKGEVRVKIRFDNYSPKWDETYTIDDFKKGQVSPLYSYALPRPRQIMEFSVHHRRTNRKNTGNSLFGQTFQLHCHNEWSSARAGAHVLAQASRFLHSATKKEVSVSKDGGEGEVQEKVYLPAKEAHAAIAQVIEVLLAHDRELVQSALRFGGYQVGGGAAGEKKNEEEEPDSVYDAAVVAARLEKRLSTLLPLLPFDLKICVADALLGSQQGSGNEEQRFPYDVLRSIGNLMTARHVLVLHWKDNASTTAARYPLLYVQPVVAAHKSALQLLNEMRAAKEQEAAAAEDGAGKLAAPKGLQLGECLTEFCKEQKLSSEDSWHCPKCREVREGKQSMALWRLPDILIFHLKRFNCSARWREKITTRVNFPLTGLDVNEWCDKESPARQAPEETRVYDLIGVMNHLGGMTGGHYIALCKATACSPDGSEEVGHAFNGAGTGGFNSEQGTVQTGWKFGRNKEKELVSARTRAALASARSASESSEPLWLQFDDDLVEPIPPKNVVTETAYVLFYQRRRISPSHTAKFCTLE